MPHMAMTSSVSISWISPPLPGRVSPKISKTSGVITYRPRAANRLGGFFYLGFHHHILYFQQIGIFCCNSIYNAIGRYLFRFHHLTSNHCSASFFIPFPSAVPELDLRLPNRPHHPQGSPQKVPHPQKFFGT